MKLTSKIIVFASVFLLVSLFFSCKSKLYKKNETDNTVFNDSVFAFESKGIYTFVKDTVLLKKKIEQDFLPSFKIILDKIEIKKQMTLGNNPKVFYYFIAFDFEKKIKIARWLSKDNKKLYFVNQITEGNLFEQTYVICVGNDDCYPQVFDIDNNKQWGCSTKFECDNDSLATSCKVYKSVQFD